MTLLFGTYGGLCICTNRHMLHSRQNMHTNLLSASEVQDLLDVDRSTVYRMAGDGRLPAVKVGRQWRFPADEIENLFEVVTPRTSRIDPGLAFSIIDVMARALGVQMMVTDVSGLPLTEVANPCEWFEEHADDPEIITACVDEWRVLAEDFDFAPRFRTGALGFECARTFIRSGSELVGMVLAGGIAPEGSSPNGFHTLESQQRHQVLELLPSVGALVSRCAVRPVSQRSNNR